MTDTENSGSGRTYHHGDLRAVLLAEAERVLEESGPTGMTLRAIARAAGVSHAAPKHHFSDLTDLRSALAATGFRRLQGVLREVASRPGTPDERRRARGTAYVQFVRAHPGLFALMFRTDMLDLNHPDLQASLKTGFDNLTGFAALPDGSQAEKNSLETWGRAVAMWAVAHGFAMLMLESRIDLVLDRLPGVDTDALLAQTLKSIDWAREGD